MTRRHAAAALAVLALSATSAAAAGRTPAEIAPGGNITSVVRETERHGWPHEVTGAEAADVTNLALWWAAATANPRNSTAVRCYFGATLSGAYCGVTYHRAGRRTGAYRLNVTIWEDGSYRYARPTSRARD